MSEIEVVVEVGGESERKLRLDVGMLEGNGDDEHSKGGAVLNLELVDARRLSNRLAPSDRRARVAREPRAGVIRSGETRSG